MEVEGRGRKENSNKVLEDLVVAQQLETDRLRNEVRDITSSEELFAWYSTTDRLQKIYEEIVRSNIGSKEEHSKFKRKLADGIFKDLAFVVLSLKQPSERTLLSPEKTLKFFESLREDCSVNGLVVEKKSIVLAIIYENDPQANLKDLAWKDFRFHMQKEKFQEYFRRTRLEKIITPDSEEMPFNRFQFNQFIQSILPNAFN